MTQNNPMDAADPVDARLDHEQSCPARWESDWPCNCYLTTRLSLAAWKARAEKAEALLAHVERPVDAEVEMTELLEDLRDLSGIPACQDAATKLRSLAVDNGGQEIVINGFRRRIETLEAELARQTAPVTDVDVAGHCQRLREIVLIDIKDQVLLNVKSADLIENLWRRLRGPAPGDRAEAARWLRDNLPPCSCWNTAAADLHFHVYECKRRRAFEAAELLEADARQSALAKADALTAEPDEAVIEAAAFEAFKAEWSQETWNAMQRESYIESAKAWSAAFLRAARPA